MTKKLITHPDHIFWTDLVKLIHKHQPEIPDCITELEIQHTYGTIPTIKVKAWDIEKAQLVDFTLNTTMQISRPSVETYNCSL